jgi:hypothetical protein
MDRRCGLDPHLIARRLSYGLKVDVPQEYGLEPRSVSDNAYISLPKAGTLAGRHDDMLSSTRTGGNERGKGRSNAI